MSQKDNKCQATGKTRFRTPGEAKEAMTSLKARPRFYQNGKRVNRRMGKLRQTRYYWCSFCRGYHFTSKHRKTTDGFLKELKPFFDKRDQLIIDRKAGAEWKKDSLPFPENPT